MAYDLQYSYVTLLLHANGTNGAVTTTDNSSYGKTMTFVGTAALSTTQAKYGSASLSLPGGSSGYLTTPTHASTDITSGDFTVEAWVYRAAAGAVHNILNKRGVGTDGWALRINADNTIQFFFTGGSSITSVLTVGASAWVHIAVSRTGNSVNIFVDGVGMTPGTFANGTTNTSETLKVGCDDGLANGFNGYLDDIRLTKGYCRYVANFTPPTAEFGDSAPPSANLTASLPMLTFVGYGGGNLIANLPMLLFYAGPAVTAQLDAHLPMLTFQSFGGARLDAMLPMLTFHGEAHQTGDGFAARLPMLTFQGFTGAVLDAELPMLQFTGSATVPILMTMRAQLPMLQFNASGKVSERIQLDARLPMLQFTAVAGGTLVAELPMLQFTGSGKVGAVAQLIAELPMLLFEGEATRQAHAQLIVTLPALRAVPSAAMRVELPMLQFVGSVTMYAVTAYEAYAVNLIHKGGRPNAAPVDEVTHYTNYPFDHIVRWVNDYYGVSGTAMYRLGATDDDGTPIDWAFRTHIEDFGNEEKNTVRSVFFGGRLGSEAEITLYLGEHGQESQSFTTPRDATAKNHRQKLGRGNKERYQALGVTGDDELMLDNLTPLVEELKRKV